MRFRRRHAAAAAVAAALVWRMRRVLAAEAAPPERRQCADCGKEQERAQYSARQWKGALRCAACVAEAQRKNAKPTSIVCPYCENETLSPTKEHLLPKSVGGTYTIWVCGECNAARQCSGTFPAFRDYVEARPHEWALAVRSCKKNASTKRVAWLVESNLIELTISALE